MQPNAARVPEPGAQDALIHSHLSYAHALAAEILRTVPASVERKELESAAELGLAEAARSFDASRGVQFKTFAYYRIRGSIYDSLRKMGWFSRSAYQDLRFHAAANDLMADESTGQQSEGVDIEALAGSVVQCYMVSLDAARHDAVDPGDGPEKKLERRQSSDMVREALRRLPEKNRKILEAYYYQDRTLEEIGAGMGLSKSWLCRMHAKSIELMREAMAELTRAPKPAATAGAGGR
ncbi:MAG: sigma-70 family RNA polymerase sigma factor [Bryobacteraceae bacterium]